MVFILWRWPVVDVTKDWSGLFPRAGHAELTVHANGAKNGEPKAKNPVDSLCLSAEVSTGLPSLAT
jgi:hypothetical protein